MMNTANRPNEFEAKYQIYDCVNGHHNELHIWHFFAGLTLITQMSHRSIRYKQ